MHRGRRVPHRAGPATATGPAVTIVRGAKASGESSVGRLEGTTAGPVIAAVAAPVRVVLVGTADCVRVAVVGARTDPVRAEASDARTDPVARAETAATQAAAARVLTPPARSLLDRVAPGPAELDQVVRDVMTGLPRGPRDGTSRTVPIARTRTPSVRRASRACPSPRCPTR